MSTLDICKVRVASCQLQESTRVCDLQSIVRSGWYVDITCQGIMHVQCKRIYCFLKFISIFSVNKRSSKACVSNNYIYLQVGLVSVHRICPRNATKAQYSSCKVKRTFGRRNIVRFTGQLKSRTFLIFSISWNCSSFEF